MCVFDRIFAAFSAEGGPSERLMIDSTDVKAHRSAAGGKGGSGRKESGARGAAAPRKSISWPMIAADRSRSP